MGLVVAAATGVYSFVRTAQDGELRHACGPLCVAAPAYAGHNRLAPSFELENLTGGKASLSKYAGKVVVLNFWTKNCEPCLQEMPNLAKFATTLKARSDGVLITVTTDDTREDVQKTLARVLGGQPPPFEVWLDPEARVVTGVFGTRLYPETWFIDPNGVIRARIDGVRDYSEPIWTELVESLQTKQLCQVEFQRSVPRGTGAAVCADFVPASVK